MLRVVEAQLLLCCCVVVLLLCVLTLGSGQQPHFSDLLLRQQVSLSLQLVWSSHGFTSSASASSASSIGSLDLIAITITAGSLRHMGVDSDPLLQVKVVRSQVVPVGQQCSWSAQQTA